MRYRVILLGLAMPALLLAHQRDQPLPRFRAGANLVRVDAYVSKDDLAITNLTADDFELFEDDNSQRIRTSRSSRCDQMRMRLSQIDHERDVLRLLQRADRANVSFFGRRARPGGVRSTDEL